MRTAAIPLTVAFGVASSVANAQDPNDPMIQLRACSVMEQRERLQCLEMLSRNIAPVPAPAPRRTPEADNWIVSETTSPVDYTPIVTATALHRSGADGSAMQLSIRCGGGRTELVVTGPNMPGRGDDFTISYRINENPPVQFAAVTPSSGTGAAFRGDVVRLLQSLPGDGGVAIRLLSRSGVAMEGYFLLAPLRMTRDRISTACRWPQAVSTPRN